jgi:hypothetical protein
MLTRPSRQITLVSLLALGLAACGSPVSEADFEPAVQSAAPLLASTTVELIAVQDARTQHASPDQNFGSGILWTNTLGHQVFVQFDLNALPVNAVIQSAALKLYFNGHYAGPNDVQVGRVEGIWDESTLTANNQPSIVWNGPSEEVGDAAGDIGWDVTALVRAWQTGAAVNHGFGLRSEVPGGKQFASKENATQAPPRLVVTYTMPTPLEGPLPDLGDAPDSTNHHGVPNTAYFAGGVPGSFPTVWQVPAGQPAGPRHDNLTLEAFLGNFVSREIEADAGPDQDGPNNILRNAAGVIADVADNDRGDDGWRNRNFRFYDCYRHTLRTRVTRPLGATQPVMYLNVWFDGTRDGDWADTGPCLPPTGGPPQASYEWLVQDFLVNMAAIAPGSFVDIDVLTERVHNLTPGLPHWMRFTLSETPAVSGPFGGLPDGRGPHPLSAAQSFEFGETEDVLQIPPPPPTAADELLLE